MGSLSLHTSVQVVLIRFYDHRCQGYMTNVLTHAPYTQMVCGLCGRSGYTVKNCDIPGAEKYRQLLVLPLVFFSVALVSSFFPLVRIHPEHQLSCQAVALLPAETTWSAETTPERQTTSSLGDESVGKVSQRSKQEILWDTARSESAQEKE